MNIVLRGAAGPRTSPAVPAALRAVELLHTVVWAFFAGCIVLIPLFAIAHRIGVAVALIGVVFIEVVVILVNRWRCPLTGIAARYTDDRRDHFDIDLPEWLARHNKTIFGGLYIAGVLVTIGIGADWFPALR